MNMRVDGGKKRREEVPGSIEPGNLVPCADLAETEQLGTRAARDEQLGTGT